jgi:large subunit ribosomal protein L22
MEIKVSARFQPLAPRKTRLVVDLVRGMSVNEALETLRQLHQRPARSVDKLIRSGIAAAMEQHDTDAEELYIKRIWVDGGPMRYWRLPRMRGTWSRIRRRSSHINVVLAEQEEE